MKKLIFSISILFVGVIIAKAQNYTWSRMPSFPHGLYAPGTFAIGDNIYVVCGALEAANSPKQLTNEVWAFNTQSNTWIQKNNFPGDAIYAPSAFVINGKGYIVNGWYAAGNATGPNTLYEYDPTNDNWSLKAPFPGITRYTCASFSLNNKGYIAAGFSPYQNELYEYDPVSNNWTQKASLPGVPRQAPIWFTIGNYAYVGMGATSGDYQVSDFFRYDPAINSWTQLNNFPSDPLQSSFCFSLNGIGYVVNGLTQDQINYSAGASNKVWTYQPSNDQWNLLTTFPDTAIFEGAVAVANGAAYLGLGASDHFNYPSSNVFWRFGPAANSTSCAASESIFRLNHAYFNFQAFGNFSSSAVLTWNFGDGTSSVGTSCFHNYSNIGTYYVSLNISDTAGSGCQNTLYDTVVVSGLSTCSVSIDANSILGQNTLYTHTTGFGPYRYNWSCQQDPSFHSSSPDPMVVLQPNTSRTYCVTISDTTGCSASACKQISYTPSVDSCQTFLYVFPEGNIPGLYYAYVYHIGGNPVSYSWTFGDGLTSADSLPYHPYSSADFYYVCLSITDDNGCTSSYCDSFFYAYKMGGGPMKTFRAIARYATGAQNLGLEINSIDIIPNPTNKTASLVIHSHYQEKYAIDVYNQLGKSTGHYDLVLSKGANQLPIDVSNLPQGVYHVVLKDSEGKMITKKLEVY